MSDFINLLKTRRSANKFEEGVTISHKELEEMFSLVKFAPSAFNLQHVHYLAVTDEQLKEKIYESTKQYKVHTSSAVIVVVGDLRAYQDVARINQGFLDLGILSKQEYDREIEVVTSFYEGRGPVFQKEEAIRNGSLSAMLFMLIAKEKGWDTCPMIGYDPQEISEILEIPEGKIPVMMITLGKEDTTKQRPRGYRKPTGEFVRFNKF
ncbi:nitroreductase family protein [Brevibacillus daliensis]|uniref:nitroreductase family protein n=1 Tax=Brevibacillus daliensis TaxID=2892995 RepID=UPI001E53296C|nr:nitroreductase family protein [Brevibacillus daliensis]